MGSVAFTGRFFVRIEPDDALQLKLRASLSWILLSQQISPPHPAPFALAGTEGAGLSQQNCCLATAEAAMALITDNDAWQFTLPPLLGAPNRY
jgi:hypothetical protein